MEWSSRTRMHRQAEAVSARSHEWQHKSLTRLSSDLLSLVFPSFGWLNSKRPSSLLCSAQHTHSSPSFWKMDGQMRRRGNGDRGEVEMTRRTVWKLVRDVLGKWVKQTSEVKHESLDLTSEIYVWRRAGRQRWRTGMKCFISVAIDEYNLLE